MPRKTSAGGIADLEAARVPPHVKDRLNPKDLKDARRAAFPDKIAPMLATLTDKPFSADDWYFEPKLDGFRIIAFVNQGKIKLQSRGGLDVTDHYPSIVAELEKISGLPMVIDGEVIALDDAGHPCFQCLQNHLKALRQSDERESIIYYVFDMIHLDGYDITHVPLEQRKVLLDQNLASGKHARLIAHFAGDGKAVYEAALDQGMEGVVAKRMDSVYQIGRRSTSWLKIKGTLSDEFVIGGYTQGTGARASTFGALLVGQYAGGKLIYSGHVGTGYNDETLEDLLRRLSAIKTDEMPFAEKPPMSNGVQWTPPKLVAEVKFAQWTQEGYLRVPVFLRLRDDKAASEVHRQKVVPPPQK